MSNIQSRTFFRDKNHEIKLQKYIDFLWNYNQKVNLFSRKSKIEALHVLINETLLLENHITKDIVIDMGSGNGLLGIPVGISNPQKKVILVEPKQKKSQFLFEAVKRLNTENITVVPQDAREFMGKLKDHKNCIAARGFPDNQILIDFLKHGLSEEILLITSMSKVKKIKRGIEKLKQNLYNIPLRDNLKIFKLESVSRETNEKRV
jgi:16S rRNA (guanine(527)-N(7))-methyltransferase RsmG